MENGENVGTEKQEAPTLSKLEKIKILQVHFDRAERGDVDSLPHVQQLLDDNPEMAIYNGSLAVRIQLKWIRLVCGDDLVLREYVVRSLNDLRKKITGESAADIEVLMVEEILTSWLRKYYFEARLSDRTNDSLEWSQYRLKEFTTMQRLFDKSLSNLVQLRRLVSKTDCKEVSLETKQSPVLELGNVVPVTSATIVKDTSCEKVISKSFSSNDETNQFEKAFETRPKVRKIALAKG